MATLPIVILDKIEFSKLAYGITDASNKMHKAGIESKPLDSAMLALTDINNKFSKQDIDSLVKLLTEPGEKIYTALKEALADGKINLKDIGNGIDLIKGVSDAIDLLNPSWEEIKDLDYSEIEIITILLFREVRELLGAES